MSKGTLRSQKVSTGFHLVLLWPSTSYCHLSRKRQCGASGLKAAVAALPYLSCSLSHPLFIHLFLAVDEGILPKSMNSVKKNLLLESEKNSQVGLQVWSKAAAAASRSGAGPVTAQRWEQHVGRAFLTWHQAPLWPSLPFGCFPGCLPLRALGVLGNSPHTCAASYCVCSPTSESPCPAVQVLVSCWMGKRAQCSAPVSPCPAWLVTAGVLCHIPAGPAMLPAPLSSEHLALLWLQLQR